MHEWQPDRKVGAAPGAAETSDDRTVLALDLGATWIRAAGVGVGGSILCRVSRHTGSGRDPSMIVEDCIAALHAAYDGLGVPGRESVAGVGISAPGPVDAARGIIVDPPNLGHEFHEVPIVEAVEAALGLPAVLERDTNVAALGEHAFGAGRGVDDLVYLTVSSGVGGAVISHGGLLRGADGTAGELGHMTIDLDGPPCGCGERGHLEAISSGMAIARAGREAAAEGRSPVLFGVAGRVGLEHLEAVDVAEAEAAGDPAAAGIMEDARRAFATALVGITNAFNPSRIIVGGTIARAQGERLLGPAREAVVARAFRIPGRRVEVVPAALGDDVGLAGALPLVMRSSGNTRSKPRGPSNGRRPAGPRVQAGAATTIA